MPILYILSNVARELLTAFIFNYRFLPIYIIVILLIKMQNEKHMSVVAKLSDKPTKKVWEVLQETIFFGAIIGFVSGIVMVFLGITFEPVVFEYLITIMAVSLLFNFRFICITYSAGILGLIAIIFKIPNINVTSLLVLVSILHFFESILVFIGAGKDCKPVYIRRDKGIAGAFITRKIWPIPVVFIIIVTQAAPEFAFNSISIDWWTLFKPELLYPGAIAFALDCSISLLSYNDISISMTPEKKSRKSALYIMIYSIILFIIAVISRDVSAFKLVGAIFALVAHEFIYLFGRYRESTKEPLFVSVRRGVRVFDVLPQSNAYKIGIRRGDIILSINNMDVQTEEGITEALRKAPNLMWVKVIDAYGNEKIHEYKSYPDGVDKLEILTIPRENEVTYNIQYYEKINILKNLSKRFRDNGKFM